MRRFRQALLPRRSLRRGPLACAVAARLPPLSRVILPATANPIQHRLRVGRALGVADEHRMPCAAVGAAYLETRLKRWAVVHAISVNVRRDRAGPTITWERETRSDTTRDSPALVPLGYFGTRKVRKQ